jgi:Single-strand binding protein family
MGDPPRLDPCYPGLAGGQGLQFATQNPFKKTNNPMNMNKVILIGFAGKDAKTSATQSGKTMTRLSIATSKRYKDAAGEWQERTQWHDCVAYGPTGDYAAKVLKGAHHGRRRARAPRI